MKLLPLTRSGLASLCLLLSLTACGNKGRINAALTPIPAEFTEDCPETAVPISVNADLAIKIITLKADLRSCNADKRAMRAYNRIIKEKSTDEGQGDQRP